MATPSYAIGTIAYIETFMYPDAGVLSKVYPVLPMKNPLHMTIHISSYLSTHFGEDVAKVILGYANGEHVDHFYVGLYCPNSMCMFYPNFKDSEICTIMSTRDKVLSHVQPILVKKGRAFDRYLNRVSYEHSNYGRYGKNGEYDEKTVSMAFCSIVPGSYLVFRMTNPNPKFS